jgi:hypothetical protein
MSFLKKLVILVLLVCLTGTIQAQRWKSYRQEIGGSIGPTFFLSDVGGFQEEPTNSISDLNFVSTRFAVGFNYNYFVRQDMSIVAQVQYGWLEASDEFAGNAARRNRNFNIRTHYVEAAVLYRFYFFKEKFGHVFRLRGTRSQFLSKLAAYGTIGFGGMWFNPTGKYKDGKYYPLQPLNTEGQGLPGGPDPYKRITFTVPVGVGAKYALNPQMNIGAEIMFRKVFSDYLDDVSTVYYDNTAIFDKGGEVAAFLADPNDGSNPSWTNPGESRGGANFDDFFGTLMFSFNYKFLKGKSFRPRF